MSGPENRLNSPRPLPHRRGRDVLAEIVVPTSYPVPTDGPVGDMLRACGRHPMLFRSGDKYLDSDAVFGKEEAAKFGVETPFYRAHYDFVMKPGVSSAVTNGAAVPELARI